jgi:glycosyltransferase involved in cell wall biosynthesis
MPPGLKTRRRRKIPDPPIGHKWPANSIVYICGSGRVKFGPSDNDLGGSEQAVVKLSQCWTALNYQVVVYGNVKEGMYDGVEYRSINKLNLLDTFDRAIVWRSYGIRFLPVINANKIFIDLHDSWDPTNYVDPKLLLEKADAIMLKSNYHRSLYKYIPNSKAHIIMNGVQVDLFNSIIKNIPESDRQPHKLIYASSYDRGLEPLLRYSWPIIKSKIPDATFDIYYGMNRLDKTPLGKKLLKLFKQDGVTEHGRVSLKEIAKQKSKSAIHLYVSNCESEIDCISIRESLLCGSIPVLGNDYVFKERDGVHITGSTNDPATYKKAGMTVASLLLKDPSVLAEKRKELKKSETIISWETVAKKWLDYMF